MGPADAITTTADAGQRRRARLASQCETLRLAASVEAPDTREPIVDQRGGRAAMRKAAILAALMSAAVLTLVSAPHAQRQVAPPVTDPADPKYLTAQTRKMGGPMPAEQMALIFEHLDLALKVFPDQQRIEGVTTLTLRTKAPI